MSLGVLLLQNAKYYNKMYLKGWMCWKNWSVQTEMVDVLFWTSALLNAPWLCLNIYVSVSTVGHWCAEGL